PPQTRAYLPALVPDGHRARWPPDSGIYLARRSCHGRLPDSNRLLAAAAAKPAGRLSQSCGVSTLRPSEDSGMESPARCAGTAAEGGPFVARGDAALTRPIALSHTRAIAAGLASSRRAVRRPPV